MTKLGWTIETIGYNKDKNAYLASRATDIAATGALGAAIGDAMTSRRYRREGEMTGWGQLFWIIVVAYLVFGFAVGTWGYIKQSIIWLLARADKKVGWFAMAAHLLLPIATILIPVYAIRITRSEHIMQLVLAIIFSGLVVYHVLGYINKNQGVDDFIGFGAASLQMVSCSLVYGFLLFALLNAKPSIKQPNPPGKNSSSVVKSSATSDSQNPVVINVQMEPIKTNDNSPINYDGKNQDAQAASQNIQQVTEPRTAVKGHQAFVYKPPSNVRSNPNGDVLCSIDEPTNIMVYDYAGSTYNGTREVKWYYTDACGSMGVIAYSQFR